MYNVTYGFVSENYFLISKVLEHYMISVGHLALKSLFGWYMLSIGNEMEQNCCIYVTLNLPILFQSSCSTLSHLGSLLQDAVSIYFLVSCVIAVIFLVPFFNLSMKMKIAYLLKSSKFKPKCCSTTINLLYSRDHWFGFMAHHPFLYIKTLPFQTIQFSISTQFQSQTVLSKQFCLT